MIDSYIAKNTDNAWRFTRFYGEPETNRRIEAWNTLRRLNHHPNIPWLCAGDFNEIIKPEEKMGGVLRNNAQMQLFIDVIDECGFMDLSYSGTQFTSSKHYEDGHSI